MVYHPRQQQPAGYLSRAKPRGMRDKGNQTRSPQGSEGKQQMESKGSATPECLLQAGKGLQPGAPHPCPMSQQTCREQTPPAPHPGDVQQQQGQFSKNRTVVFNPCLALCAQARRGTSDRYVLTGSLHGSGEKRPWGPPGPAPSTSGVTHSRVPRTAV